MLDFGYGFVPVWSKNFCSGFRFGFSWTPRYRSITSFLLQSHIVKAFNLLWRGIVCSALLLLTMRPGFPKSMLLFYALLATFYSIPVRFAMDSCCLQCTSNNCVLSLSISN
ncbi:unnamed protein product [Ixodes persulcatus]